MITEEQALEIGIETTTRCANWFHETNASHLQTVGIDREDLVQHLSHQVLVRKFLPLLRSNPSYYQESTKGKKEIEAYKSSVYVSARRVCFALHRGQIRSQKRGMALLNGPVLLDHPDVNADSILHSRGRSEVQSGDLHKVVADALPNLTMKRVWSLLVYGNEPSIKKIVPDQAARDSMVARIKATANHLTNPYSDTMTEDFKSRMKSLVAKATQNGQLTQRKEEETDQLFHTVVDKLKKVDRSRLATLNRVLDSDEELISRDRPSRIIENAKILLDTDYEILSDAFGVEVNSEMTTSRVVGVLTYRVSGMSTELKEEIPSYIWDIYRGLCDMVRDSLPRTSSNPEDEPQDRGQMVVRKQGDIFEISGVGRADEFLRGLLRLERFSTWVNSNGIKYSVRDGVLVLEGDKIKGASKEFVLAILKSFDQKTQVAQERVKPKEVSRKPQKVSELQLKCLETVVNPIGLADIAKAIGKPVAAANSAMEALRRSGRVASQRIQMNGQEKTLWTLT